MAVQRAASAGAVKAAGYYFLLANVIFFLGTNGKIDAFIWGASAYIVYWPFSILSRLVWKAVDVRTSGFYGSYTVVGHLYVPHLLTYALDVIGGTAWWFAVRLIFLAWRGRRAAL